MGTTPRLIRILFPCDNSIGPFTERFKSSGCHGWVLQIDAIRIRRGTYSYFTFKNTLEIILKREMCMKNPYSNFVSLHLSLECKGLDVRLYMLMTGGKQMDVLSENLVFEKSQKKPFDEKSTQKSGFFYDSLCATVLSTEGGYSAGIDIVIYKIMPDLFA